MVETIVLIAQIAAGVLLADVISGVLHWAQDRYGDARTPIFGRAIAEAARHHVHPRRILARSFWQRNGRVFVIAGAFAAAFALLGWINPVTVTAILFGAFTNEIHACAHRMPEDNSPLVRALQRLRLFLPFREHAGHHRANKASHYCVVTGWANPMLDGLQVWKRVEVAIARITGIRPRVARSFAMRHRPRLTFQDWALMRARPYLARRRLAA